MGSSPIVGDKSSHSNTYELFSMKNTIMKTDSFLAQRLACRAHNPKVGGSIPPEATMEEIKRFILLGFPSGQRGDT